MKDMENVKQARERFNRIIDNKMYVDIIRDENKYQQLGGNCASL